MSTKGMMKKIERWLLAEMFKRERREDVEVEVERVGIVTGRT